MLLQVHQLGQSKFFISNTSHGEAICPKRYVLIDNTELPNICRGNKTWCDLSNASKVIGGIAATIMMLTLPPQMPFHSQSAKFSAEQTDVENIFSKATLCVQILKWWLIDYQGYQVELPGQLKRPSYPHSTWYHCEVHVVDKATCCI